MNRLSFGRVTLGASVMLILAFLMIPVVIVVPLSFSDARFLTFPPPAYSLRWYHAFFDNPRGSTPPRRLSRRRHARR